VKGTTSPSPPARGLGSAVTSPNEGGGAADEIANSLHIRNIPGQNVNSVCGLVDDKSLDMQINARRIKYLSKTCINIV